MMENRATVVQGGASEKGPSQLTAQVIKEFYLNRYRDSKGTIGFADVFNALGSLAGFGCQMSIRVGFIKTGKITEDKAFVIVGTKDGGKYFFGDILNTGLLGDGKNQISVWQVVGGAAMHSGAKELPDVKGIAEYNAKTLGSNAFGIPRTPELYRSHETPIDILKRDWPAMQRILEDGKLDPRFWGWSFALAAQELIVNYKNVFDPGMAAKIVMEAAMPMSKIDPEIIGRI